jgi:hypothetical protein
MSDNLFYLQAEILQLQADNNRLKAGKFTPEELQNLCHEQQGNAESFAQGCCAYQVELFGRSPTADKIKEREEALSNANKLIEELSKELEELQDKLKKPCAGCGDSTHATVGSGLDLNIDYHCSTCWREAQATIKRLNESKVVMLPPREREPLTFPKSCNRHGDCDEADAIFEKRNGRKPGYGFHCHNDECDECFGS